MAISLEHSLTGDELRKAFSAFPSGVIALSGVINGEPLGMAASSYTSVSLDPPLVSVCIRNESLTWIKLRTADTLGVSILSSTHDKTCRALASKDPELKKQIPWTTNGSSTVFVNDAASWLECSLYQEIDAGDHIIALLEIKRAYSNLLIEPLVFHRSGYRSLSTAP